MCIYKPAVVDISAVAAMIGTDVDSSPGIWRSFKYKKSGNLFSFRLLF